MTIGRSWVQFLVMTEWKNLIFSENFTFSDFRPGCNKFYSGPCRTSLHRDWPLPKSPLPPGGKRGKFPHPFRAKHCYISKKFQFFRLPTESNMCSSVFFPSRLPPSKAPLSTGRSWVQFLVMTEWKNLIFSENVNFSGFKPYYIREWDVIGFIQVRAVSTPYDVLLAP